MRIVITLNPDERAALGAMACDDLRHPRDQIRYLLREAARTRGLLSAEPVKETPNEPADTRRAA